MRKTTNQLKEEINHIISILEKTYGAPVFSPPNDLFALLVRTILSQNTNDTNRDRAYAALIKRYPTWQAMAQAKRADIAKAITPAGLFNQKSRWIKDLLVWVKKLCGDYSIDFIKEMRNEEIITLFSKRKGIGIKTIGIVLLFGLGRDVFPVDTHVNRICGRLGLVAQKSTPEKTFKAMQALVPAGKSMSLHVNMIRFGKERCKKRNPVCYRCPLYDLCVFEKKCTYYKTHEAHFKRAVDEF